MTLAFDVQATPTAGLFDGQRAWDAAEIDAQADRLAAVLRERRTRVLATLLDNSPAWVVADRAAERAGVVHVPLPLFFTPAQIAHALAAAGVDTLLATPAFAAQSPTPRQACTLAQEALVLLTLAAPATGGATLPADTAKVSFTSGTTGAPKGVCLSLQALRAVSDGLALALAPLQIERHLCALPFAVLLENIAGLMVPLCAGASCVVLPLATLGWQGSSSFDPARFHAAVTQHQPHSLILLPQMLRAWVDHLVATGARAPASLRFVAVGGAAVGEALVRRARAVGIPAFEGYGLSEGASVQTLNRPGADRPGSVGRPLPQARLRLAADGEIEVGGSRFSGYLGEPRAPGEAATAWWPTGDLGRIDSDGFVHVLGRKKHVLITAFGRNVSPEWVEGALRDAPAVAQAVVFGNGQTHLGAVVWPRTQDVADGELDAAVALANAGLPDYARIGRWTRARAPFTADSGMATANGRPRRADIEALHRDALFGVATEALLTLTTEP